MYVETLLRINHFLENSQFVLDLCTGSIGLRMQFAQQHLSHLAAVRESFHPPHVDGYSCIFNALRFFSCSY